MKILLLGDSESVWMKRFVQNVCLNQENEVYILAVCNKKNKDFYDKNKVKVKASRKKDVNLKKYDVIKYALEIFSKVLQGVRWGKFDIIHIHFVSLESLVIANVLAGSRTKIISSYWGSDLLRQSDKMLKVKKLFLKRSNIITLETDFMLKKFHNAYGNKFDYKIRKIIFGVTGLDDIRSILNHGITRSECKKKLGIDRNKSVIAVGYNAIKAQQHLKVLECIGKLPEEYRDNIHILLQMTYGNSNETYEAEIKKALSNIKCSFSMFRTFLSDREVAEIRLVTDIFIHAQTTDSLSATIQENLFVGNIVLNPKWIQYDILKSNVIFYMEYTDWADLEKRLYKIIKEPERYRQLCLGNQEKMYELASWGKVSEKWKRIYRSE